MRHIVANAAALILMAVSVFGLCPQQAAAQASIPMTAHIYETPMTKRPDNLVETLRINTSFALLTSKSLTAEHFSGQNMGVELTAQSPSSGTFTVKLYRGTSYIGSATLKRNGYSRAEWTNVGPGVYRFVFSKTNDGKVVTCTGVRTFSW